MQDILSLMCLSSLRSDRRGDGRGGWLGRHDRAEPGDGGSASSVTGGTGRQWSGRRGGFAAAFDLLYRIRAHLLDRGLRMLRTVLPKLCCCVGLEPRMSDLASAKSATLLELPSPMGPAPRTASTSVAADV